MLCSWAVFHAKVILLQGHDPSANQCLIRGIRLQPGQGLVIHSQGELSWTKITVVFHNEVVGCKHFQFGSSILGLCDREFLGAIYYRSQAPFTWRTLPLVQDARDGNSADVSVQHKLFFGIGLRKRSRLDQGFLDFVECFLLFRSPGERDV